MGAPGPRPVPPGTSTAHTWLDYYSARPHTTPHVCACIDHVVGALCELSSCRTARPVILAPALPPSGSATQRPFAWSIKGGITWLLGAARSEEAGFGEGGCTFALRGCPQHGGV